MLREEAIAKISPQHFSKFSFSFFTPNLAFFAANHVVSRLVHTVKSMYSCNKKTQKQIKCVICYIFQNTENIS